MKKLSKPNFENLKYGAGGGLPIVKSLWEKFGFSYLFSNIDKHSGTSPWKMVFAYITGLIANSGSVNKIAGHCHDAPVLQEILSGIIPSQSALSRYFSRPLYWLGCSVNRIEVFYRNAKQELGLTSCHSQSKAAHEAHIEMIFIAETLLTYANWELNKDGAVTLTHGEMIREIINANHRICLKDKLQIYFAISGSTFTRLFKKFLAGLL